MDQPHHDEKELARMIEDLKGWFRAHWFRKNDAEDFAAETMIRACRVKHEQGMELTRRDFGLVITIAKRYRIDQMRRANLINRIDLGYPAAMLAGRCIDDSQLWRRIQVDEIVKDAITKFPVGEDGNWAECVSLLPNAKPIVDYILEREDNSAEAFEYLYRVGWCLYFLGSDRLKEAAKVFRGAYETAEKLPGRDGLLHQATSLNALGAICRQDSSLGDSRKYAEHSVAMRRELLGSEHLGTTEAEINLANTLAKKKDSRTSIFEAGALIQRACDHRRRRTGPRSRLTLFAMNDKAEILAMQGDFRGAERLHIETWGIRRDELGTSHGETIGSALHLAQLYAHYWPADQRMKGLSKAEEWLYQVNAMVCRKRHGVLYSECREEFRTVFGRPF